MEVGGEPQHEAREVPYLDALRLGVLRVCGSFRREPQNRRTVEPQNVEVLGDRYYRPGTAGSNARLSLGPAMLRRYAFAKRWARTGAGACARTGTLTPHLPAPTIAPTLRAPDL